MQHAIDIDFFGGSQTFLLFDVSDNAAGAAIEGSKRISRLTLCFAKNFDFLSAKISIFETIRKRLRLLLKSNGWVFGILKK